MTRGNLVRVVRADPTLHDVPDPVLTIIAAIAQHLVVSVVDGSMTSV